MLNVNLLKLKLAMAEKQFSTDDLAKAVGMSDTTIYSVMNGANPTTKTLGKIAHALGVSVASLLSNDPD